MAKRSFISLELAGFLCDYLEFSEETIRSGNSKIKDQDNDENCNKKNQNKKEKEDELSVKNLDLLLLKTNQNNLDDAQINKIPVNISDFEGTHEDADNDNDSGLKDDGFDLKHDGSDLNHDGSTIDVNGSDLKDDGSDFKDYGSDLNDDSSDLNDDGSDKRDYGFGLNDNCSEINDDVFYSDEINVTEIQNKVVSKEQEDWNQRSYEERDENMEARKDTEAEKKHNEKMRNYEDQGLETKLAENTERMIYPKRKSFVYSSLNINDGGQYSDNEGNFKKIKCSKLKWL